MTKPDTMRVRVTLEFNLPCVPGVATDGLLKGIVYDHTLQAAINWHATQAMKWACKEGEENPITKVHTNWSEWLTQPDGVFEVKVL